MAAVCTVSVAIGDVVVAILGSFVAVHVAVVPVVVVVAVVDANVVVFILYVLAKIVRCVVTSVLCATDLS